ncbi:MAG: DinB family protein [Flavobacteriales bacterium]
MYTEIQLRIDRLQASKQLMEAAIAAASCDTNRAPQGEWSIAQVLEHLLASEGGTLGYMKKKSSGGWDSLEVAAAEHNEKSAAIHARLESNERYKAPDVLPCDVSGMYECTGHEHKTAGNECILYSADIFILEIRNNERKQGKNEE